MEIQQKKHLDIQLNFPINSQSYTTYTWMPFNFDNISIKNQDFHQNILFIYRNHMKFTILGN